MSDQLEQPSPLRVVATSASGGTQAMTREQVRDVVRPYPNLEAIVIGCVSGSVTEWPMIRGELIALVSQLRTELAQAQEAYRQDMSEMQGAVESWRVDAASVREELDELKALYEDSCSALNAHMDVYTETVNELKQARVRIAELEEKP